MHRTNELKPLMKETTAKFKAERPVQFDYQAHIKKIVLSSEGDTKHYDGLNISKALMQIPFIEFNTAVIKVSNFITFAKKEAVKVNNLNELSGKSIQVMSGESEIMVIKIFGKEDSLIWWGNDVNHQKGLQILTSNRNPFCPSNEEFSFDVFGKIKLSYHTNVAQFRPEPALTNGAAATDLLQIGIRNQGKINSKVLTTPSKKRVNENESQNTNKKRKLLDFGKLSSNLLPLDKIDLTNSENKHIEYSSESLENSKAKLNEQFEEGAKFFKYSAVLESKEDNKNSQTSPSVKNLF